MEEKQTVSIISKFWALSLVRYFIVAGSVTLFYLSLVALGISLGINYMVAILIAQSFAVLIGFPLYRFFVFKSIGKPGTDFLKFLTVWSTGAAAGLIGTPLLVEFLDWDPLISQILAIITISTLSYLAHYLFSFKNK